MKKVYRFKFIALLFLSFSWNLTAQIKSEKPNIVFILCDDLGYGEIAGLAATSLAPAGGKISTPGVDSLINNGMVFTDAHSGSSVCTPTRYGIMTGRYSWRTILQSGVVQGFDDNLVKSDRPTIGNFLRDEGYNTALIGKWHLNFRYVNPVTGVDYKENDADVIDGIAPVGATIPDGPLDRGFDYYHGFHHAKDMKAVIENRAVIEHDAEINMLPRLNTKAQEYITDQANDGDDKPFFLYVPLGSPHTPILPSVEWQGSTGLGDYADFVAQTDGVVGDILESLKDNGFEDNTLVIFSSDNGTSIKSDPDGLAAEGHIVSGGYRGIKSDLWDGGHRVPFIVKWPGVVSEGSISNETICLTDMFATFGDLIDTALPSKTGEDSVSFLPVLSGNSITTTRAGVVHHGASGHFGYRLGDYKLLLATGSAGLSFPQEKNASNGDPLAQLYNMSTDPEETTNLYETNPTIATQLYNQLSADVFAGRSTDGEASANDDLGKGVIELWKSDEDTAFTSALETFVFTVDETLATEQFVFGNGSGNNQIDLIQGTGSTFTGDNVTYQSSYVKLLSENKGQVESDAGGVSFSLQANSGEILNREIKISLRKRKGNAIAGTVTVNGVVTTFLAESDGTDLTTFEDVNVVFDTAITITDTPILVKIDFTTIDTTDAPGLKGQVRIEHIDIVGQGVLLSFDNIKGADDVKVYPNPVVDNLTITTSTTNISRIQIISVTGVRVLDDIWQGSFNTKKIDVSNFNEGVYFVVLSNDRNETIRKKIIITK